MLVYWFACGVLLWLTGKLLNLGLAWNLFLAVLPLFFIEKARSSAAKGWHRFWLFLWLLFFPNSLYPITSFIHLSTDIFYWVEGDYPNERVIYQFNIYIWLKVFLIGIGFFISILAGLQSLQIFEREIRKTHSQRKSRTAVLLVCFLSGLAVFWGRFLRLNSWDIFTQPWNLLKEIFGIWDVFALQFAAAFTVFSFSAYVIYRVCQNTFNSQKK